MPKWIQKRCNSAIKVYTHTWTQALVLFLRYDGALYFPQQSQFVGMAACKLRTLTVLFSDTTTPELGHEPYGFLSWRSIKII